jgi:hypothetical protein
MTHRVLVAALLACLASCASFPFGSLSVSEASEVPGAIAAAEADLAEARPGDGLERMLSAREILGLPIDQRDRVEVLLERCASARVAQLSGRGGDPDELADMIELGLPQQLAVEAGVAAARGYVAEDEPYDAYGVLRDLETKYPHHHGRAEASSILVDIGLKLARSDGGLWLWSDRSDSFAVLEFLVLTYPSERRCDEAFFELARLYEEDREHDRAIQRHEELLLSHMESPLAVRSQARIPHLRLQSVESPEYDRKQLLRARAELKSWLEAHAGDELELDVRVDYSDCLQRIAQSDLSIAAFYRRIDQPFGARFHAQRALEAARNAKAESLARRAEAMLAGLPEVAALPGKPRTPADHKFGHDETEIQGALDRPQEPPKNDPPKNGGS